MLLSSVILYCQSLVKFGRWRKEIYQCALPVEVSTTDCTLSVCQSITLSRTKRSRKPTNITCEVTQFGSGQMSSMSWFHFIHRPMRCVIHCFIHYCTGLNAIAVPSVCLSVRPSVRRVDHTKTVDVRIMKFSRYGSPIPPVFAWKVSSRNSKRFPERERQTRRGG